MGPITTMVIKVIMIIKVIMVIMIVLSLYALCRYTGAVRPGAERGSSIFARRGSTIISIIMTIIIVILARIKIDFCKTKIRPVSATKMSQDKKKRLALVTNLNPTIIKPISASQKNNLAKSLVYRALVSTLCNLKVGRENFKLGHL